MYLGKIVEHAKTEELFQKPYHPYTEVLLASAPKIKKREEFQDKDLLRITPHVSRTADFGDLPSPVNLPSGCPFHPRCPERFGPCDRIIPELKERDGRLVACHLWHPV